MEVEAGLLEGLWDQEANREVRTNGLVLDLRGELCAANAKARAPRIAPLCGELQHRKPRSDGAGGLTIDMAARFEDLAAGQVLLDSRDGAGRGYALRTSEGGALRFEMSDGWQGAYWDCDAGLLKSNTLHHIAVVVDGRAKVICFVVDGALNDGGAQRQFGFGRFNPTLKDVSGARELRVAPALRGELRHVRLYNRALRTSEAVGNFRALGR